MAKILILLSLLCCANLSFANDDEALNFMADKIVHDFEKGIDLYNVEKESTLPKIVEINGAYTFNIKSNKVHFTIVNYLNDQLYINDKISSFPKDAASKTTSFLDFFIKPAMANDDGDLPTLDGESAKMLLQTLSTFSFKLEKVGWTCLSGCRKDIRDKNLRGILTELNKRKEDCKEQQYSSHESIARYGRTGIVQSLAFLPAPNFMDVKQFMEKLQKSNQKNVTTFMEENLGIENKTHKSCMQVMLIGTVAEMSGDLSNLRAYASRNSKESNDAIDQAKKTCVALESLKSCLVDLHADTVVINNKKREAKDASSIDNFPNVNTTFSQTVSK
jgi:hypothetical protein